MIVLFLISGFKFTWILLLVFIFVAGYFLKDIFKGIFKEEFKKIEELKEKVIKLEADLKSAQNQIEEFQKEINTIKSGSQNASDTPSGVNLPKEEAKVIVGEQIKCRKENESIPVTDIPYTQVGHEQREKSSKRSSKFAALNNDNLQIVEGIGPKMEAVLKENGVQTWSQLGLQTQESLRTILEKYGNKYKIIDPENWPKQALHAANSNWSQLIRMQKGLDILRDANFDDTPAKIEKIMVKSGILKMYKQDDLKAIEGIGPKIAELLNVEGIILWRHLAQTSEQTLQNILDNAGKRYQLADPSSWPKQAALADKGKFEELSDYQDILQGGV